MHSWRSASNIGSFWSLALGLTLVLAACSGSAGSPSLGDQASDVLPTTQAQIGDPESVGAEPGSLLAPTLPPKATATTAPEPVAASEIPERRGLPTAPNGLLYSGPTPRSHWHAAYLVRTCNEVLDPLVDVDNRVGIHSHNDGLIHIHPASVDVAYSGATLGRFLETVGARISTGRLELPGQEPLVDGDLCGTEPGRVAIYRWDSMDATLPSEIITRDPQTARFLQDGELFTISFAPEQSPIPKPSTESLLASSPSLGQPEPDPFVFLPEDMERDSFRIWPVLSSFSRLADPPADAAELTSTERALVLCGPTAIPSSDWTVCYERTTPVLRPDSIVDVVARSVGRSPGIVLELTDSGMRDLNAAVAQYQDRGGMQIGIEINEEVLVVALAPQPFADNRIAILGGMTPDVALALEALLGRTI